MIKNIERGIVKDGKTGQLGHQEEVVGVIEHLAELRSWNLWQQQPTWDCGFPGELRA